MTRKIILACFILALAMPLLSGCQRSPAPEPRHTLTDQLNANPRDASLNLLELPAFDDQPYKFLVVGHLYGTIQGEDREPAKALLEQIPAFNKMGLRMLVSLGDMVKQSEDDDFDALERMLLAPATFPIFNSVGNHDVENRELYERRYGNTYYSFQYGSSRMIFLDTERMNCAIDDVQREMLGKAIDVSLEDDAVRQIFIFMHKTLFFKNERLFEQKKEKASPNVWDCYGKGNFEDILTTTIQPAAAKKPVYLFGGDVGAFANLSPYYERDADLPLTMIMTGLGDFPSDSAILVTVNAGDVQLELYPLTGEKGQPLESYTPEYWIKIAEEN